MVRLSVTTAACIVSSLVLVHCAAPPAAPPPATPKAEPAALLAPPPSAPEVQRLPGGSSDGTTCEEARDAHPDEVGPGANAADGPEPSDAELSAPLARGTYLDECEVPESMHVSVCAAVVGGKVEGVTVATSPSDPDKEKCVAGHVRAIEFPSESRLRVVRTSF